MRKIGTSVNYRVRSEEWGSLIETWKKCPVCPVYVLCAHKSTTARCCRNCQEKVARANRREFRQLAAGGRDKKRDSIRKVGISSC